MKKGYKAYGKGLACRGKQYKIGEIFEEEKAEICDIGMHYCENPLDCLDHYPLIDNDGEIVEMTEVEDLDEENRDTENNKKYCTKKLKIGAKLSLGEMIKASLEFIGEKSIEPASSGYCSQLASSGDNSQLASSGDNSRLASSGDYSRLASSGYNSRLASSGDNSRLASSGYYSQLASSGDRSVVANIGNRGLAKAKKGSWIVLAEYTNNGVPVNVKVEFVDGIVIKEDTWYRLQDGIFKEVE